MFVFPFTLHATLTDASVQQTRCTLLLTPSVALLPAHPPTSMPECADPLFLRIATRPLDLNW